MGNERPRDISEQVLKEIEKAHPGETLPPITPGEIFTSKLSPHHKLAILKWFACGYTVSDIQKNLLELGKLSVPQSTIKSLRNTYKVKIGKLRQDVFGDDFEHIPIAHKSVRLARYELIYSKLMARGQLIDAKRVLENARVELEGKEPLIRTGDIHQTSIDNRSLLNVSFTPDELKQVDGVFLEALERENKGESSALVGQTSYD